MAIRGGRTGDVGGPGIIAGRTRRLISNLLKSLAASIAAVLWACTTPTPTATVTPLPTPTAIPRATSTPTQTPPTTATPLVGEPEGSLVLASPARAPHQDVHQDVSPALLAMGPGIAYSRLLRIRSGADVSLPSMQVECDLCSGWEHPDPLTYVFHLREEAQWQDGEPSSGRAVTASDVAFSLERIRTPGWPGASLLQAMESVEATDESTVTVRMRYPDADFLLSLANGMSKIVSREAVDLNGDLKDGPTIGSGPWLLNEFSLDATSFEANPGYYEPGVPGLQLLEVAVIPEAFTMTAAVQVGRVDLARVDAEGFARLERSQGVQRGIFQEQGNGLLLGLNAARSPFHVEQVRQALFQAIEPWKAIENAWHGGVEVALGVPVVSPEWLLPRTELRDYLANQAGAEQLLNAAGVNLPVGFTLKVADYGDMHLALANQYKRMLDGAGFDTTLEIVNPRVYAEELWQNGEFDAFLGPVPPVDSPNAFLFGLLHSEGRWTRTGYADAELDRLIEEQSVLEQGRGEAVRRIQRYVMDKAVLFMPVMGTSMWAWQDKVEGFHPNFAASEYFYWSRLRVAEEAG